MKNSWLESPGCRSLFFRVSELYDPRVIAGSDWQKKKIQDFVPSWEFNISQGMVEDGFPFPKVGYASSLECTSKKQYREKNPVFSMPCD